MDLIPHNPLATKQLGGIELLKAINIRIPLNDYKLPVGFFRLDFLPQDGSIDYSHNPDEDEDLRIALHGAFIALNYHEGFPTLPDGRPFWSQLDFELPEAYKAFEVYLMQEGLGNGAATTTTTLVELEEAKNSRGSQQGISVRQLAMLPLDLKVEGLEMSLSDLNQFYHMYHWGARAKSYDLFRAAALRRTQELRALEVQNDHYMKSQVLMNRLSIYLDDDDDFWDLMTPKIAMDMFKTLTQLQRVSVGLNPSSSNTSASGPSVGGSMSMEVMLKQIAGQQQVEEAVIIDGDGDSQVLQRALEDEETAEAAQALIIKLSMNQE